MRPQQLLIHLFMAGLICLVATARPAAGQSSMSAGSKWEVEVHAGGAFGSNPTDGSSQLPPAGDSFTPPFPGLGPTRRVSSWYFGDGAALLNQFAQTRPVIRPMVALDPVLTKSATERRRGGGVGFRLTRVITSRFSGEFSLDSNFGHLAFVDTFLKGLEASRTGYTTTFGSLFPGSGIVSPSSEVTMRDDVGTQLLVTGAVNIQVGANARFKPYVTVGAGVAAPRGDVPRVTLTGKLQLDGRPLDGGLAEETDTVTLRVASDAAPIFMLGGGFKHDLSQHTGVRADVRVHIGKDHTRLLLDATPALSGTPSFTVIFPGTPSLVIGRPFSIPNNLSGPPIVDFEAFKGTGTRTQANVSVGYFVRF